MPKKKDPEAYLRQTKERGAKEDIRIVNDEPIQKTFKNKNKNNHNK
jgi:hypothetical protein